MSHAPKPSTHETKKLYASLIGGILALDTRNQETLRIAYWGVPWHRLWGGILALDTRNQETLCIAYWGDLSPRHTKPRNFMHRLLGGDLSPRHTKPINFKHRLLGGDISPRHTKPRNFMHRLLGDLSPRIKVDGDYI